MSDFEDLSELEPTQRDDTLPPEEDGGLPSDAVSCDDAFDFPEPIDLTASPRAVDPPRRKYLTKPEWVMTIIGWVLMSMVTFCGAAVFVLLISGLLEYVLEYIPVLPIPLIFIFFELVGAPLSVVGWLLGVKRGFGGVRTAVFVVTVVLVELSMLAMGFVCAMGGAHP